MNATTTRYVCTGTCGAKLTPEEYEKSAKVCDTPGCSMEGHEFVKVAVCETCGAILKDGEVHEH